MAKNVVRDIGRRPIHTIGVPLSQALVLHVLAHLSSDLGQKPQRQMSKSHIHIGQKAQSQNWQIHLAPWHKLGPEADWPELSLRASRGPGDMADMADQR